MRIFYLDDFEETQLDPVYSQRIEKLRGKWGFEDDYGHKFYGALNRNDIEKVLKL